MATPPEVHALIDSLAADVQVAYGAVLPGNAANAYAAQFLARALVRQGWRKVGGPLPTCWYGTPLCFDQSPYHRCEMVVVVTGTR
jgi:hypothetical protein